MFLSDACGPMSEGGDEVLRLMTHDEQRYARHRIVGCFQVPIFHRHAPRAIWPNMVINIRELPAVDGLPEVGDDAKGGNQRVVWIRHGRWRTLGFSNVLRDHKVNPQVE